MDLADPHVLMRNEEVKELKKGREVGTRRTGGVIYR